MTAPNPAIGAQPGEAFIARDGSTWVWRPAGAPAPDKLWVRVGLRGRLSRRTQKEAEAADLVKMVRETEKLVEALHTAAWVESVAEGRLAGVSLGDRVRIVPFADLVLSGSKNPNRLRTPEALRFAADVMEEAARSRKQPATELMNAAGLRAEADRRSAERALVDQASADRKRAEDELTFVEGSVYFQGEHRSVALRAIVNAIRDERARARRGEVVNAAETSKPLHAAADRQRAEQYAKATWLAMEINPGGGFSTRDLPVPEWLINSHLDAIHAEADEVTASNRALHKNADQENLS